MVATRLGLRSAEMPVHNAAPALEPSRSIPSTFVESCKSWWRTGPKTSAVSEQRLLQRLPYYATHPDASTLSDPVLSHGVVAHSSLVHLDRPEHFLNTLSFVPTTTSASLPHPAATPPPAVILHGYGAGLAFFYRNFPALGSWVASRHSPVYAIDWLGMGRSARPNFRVHASRNDTPSRVAQAEAFFIDSLEQWRQTMGINKFTLIGHSLGGYLSVAYALRFPERVERLVLLSPAGVPADPESTDTPSRELVDKQSDARSTTPVHTGTSSKTQVESIHDKQRKEKRQISRTRRLFTYLWEEGWSPFQVVRSSLFFAPLLVGKYSSRRFSGLSEEETRDMHDYILHITLAKGSGEYSISHILAPGAVARLPLVNRVSALRMPVTFVYGDHDWMDPEGGYEAVKKLRAAGNRNSKLVVIPHAGHHVYLDNHDAINELLCKELDLTVPR